MSKFIWALNRSKSSWLYTERQTGRVLGSVSIVSGAVFGVCVRHEQFEPMRWVDYLGNLEDAKNLVQTLVGVSNV